MKMIKDLSRVIKEIEYKKESESDLIEIDEDGGPTKKQIMDLVQAYALKINSAKQNAPFKSQEKFDKIFQGKYDRMKGKFIQYDMDSHEFWNQLKRMAEKWWRDRPIRGAGKDW